MASNPAPAQPTPKGENEVPLTPRKDRLLTPEDFKFGGLLGEGAFAKVLLASRKSDGKEFAVKIVDKAFIQKHKKTETVLNEKKVLSMLSHPGIVCLHYTFQDKYSLYYVLELAKNGEMFDHIQRKKKYEVDVARFYAAELVCVCEYLHSNGVIHRDLKPENILFSETGHIKVTDFGTSKITSATKAQTGEEEAQKKKSFVGTAEYVSPEVLNDEAAGVMVDMWALGCIIYHMLVGKPPFRGESEYLTFQKILNRELVFPDFVDVQARDLIDKLLVIDPAARLGGTPAGYQRLKAHPFFSKIAWANLYQQKAPDITPPDRSDDAEGLAESLGGFDISDEEEKEKEDEEEAGEPAPKAPEVLDPKSPHFIWSGYLRPNEKITCYGLVVRGRVLGKKRQLVLTSVPRFLEIDPKTNALSGEIPWHKDLWAEAKSEQNFNVHTPKSSYYFQSVDSQAKAWVNAINKVLLENRKTTTPSNSGKTTK